MLRKLEESAEALCVNMMDAVVLD